MRAILTIALVLLTCPLAARTAQAETPVVIKPASSGSVTLYRDTYGSPHLYAEREEDGYFGLGYAIAEDRLPSVLLLYRMLRGELAEAFGPGPVGNKADLKGILPVDLGDAVASDIAVRRARYLVDARVNLSRISSQQRRNAESYIAGIKAYMVKNPSLVPDWAPHLEAALPLAAEGFLMMGVSGLPGECGAGPPPAGKAASGSNIWALSAARTTDNAAVFSSDSHGSFEFFGSIFYPARVKAGAIDAWMLDIAGIPIGLKGHSRHFAWGWSEGPRHPSDCIRVPLNPANAAEYMFDGKARSFETYPYRIAVKGGPAVEGIFEYTHHNGVRSEVIRRDAASALVVSNAYMGRAGFAREEFGEMLRAKDWPAIRIALARRDIYPANIILAGSDGSILYIRPGRTPERALGADPRATVDGSTSATAWRGIYPLDRLVQTFNPLQGYLTNENVSPDMMFAEPFFNPNAYGKDFAFVPGDTGTRQLRAIELFRGTRKFSFDDLRAFVADPVIAGFERFGSALERAAPSSNDPDYIAFRNQLIGFDGRYEPKSRAALNHASWRLELRESFSAEATAIEIAVGRGQALSPEQLSVLEAAAAATFSRLRSEPRGLERAFGDRFRIGRGSVSAPARGLTLLPRADDKSGETEFGSLWGANYTKGEDGNYYARGQTRFPFLVQFTTPIRSLSVTAYGVSDNPASPHYSDQSQYMGDGTLHSNFFDSAELAGAIQSSVTLKTGKRR